MQNGTITLKKSLAVFQNSTHTYHMIPGILLLNEREEKRKHMPIQIFVMSVTATLFVIAKT